MVGAVEGEVAQGGEVALDPIQVRGVRWHVGQLDIVRCRPVADGNPDAEASDFSAAINWGVGSNSTGIVIADPVVAGQFDVLGAYTYITAGSIAPSHAYVHVEEFGVPVRIHGMDVESGDLIHADRHGAVVVPADKVDALQAALDGLIKQEARIIAAARKPGATVDEIKAAFRG